jgi:hypothetical protein
MHIAEIGTSCSLYRLAWAAKALYQSAHPDILARQPGRLTWSLGQGRPGGQVVEAGLVDESAEEPGSVGPVWC